MRSLNNVRIEVTLGDLLRLAVSDWENRYIMDLERLNFALILLARLNPKGEVTKEQYPEVIRLSGLVMSMDDFYKKLEDITRFGKVKYSPFGVLVTLEDKRADEKVMLITDLNNAIIRLQKDLHFSKSSIKVTFICPECGNVVEKTKMNVRCNKCKKDRARKQNAESMRRKRSLGKCV